MALTYEDSSALMTDMVFRGRVKVSCLNFAKYIQNEAPSVPAHSTRVKWAQSTYQNPEMIAAQVQPPTVMSDQVQLDGKNVTDADLQIAVETTVNMML